MDLTVMTQSPKKIRTLLCATLVLALTACEPATKPSLSPNPSKMQQQPVDAEQAALNQQVNQLIDELYMAQIERHPERLTALGIKKDYDKWDDRSDNFAAETQQLLRSQLGRLREIDSNQLVGETALSYRLFKLSIEQQLEDYKWRYHSYPVEQMGGLQAKIPAMLINQHTIDSYEDAVAYVARLYGVPALFEQLLAQLKKRQELGIILPKFIIPQVIKQSENLLTGAPFDEGDDSTLLADFKTKISKIKLDDNQQSKLLDAINHALKEQVAPAYQQLIAYLQPLQKVAADSAGVWHWPDGARFYQNALRRQTTTDLSADEIHALGLSEVTRLHSEMNQLMLKTGFTGSLREFFEFMREDPRFYYPDSDAGREAYLKQATAIIEQMEERLDELFISKPKAELKVKAVEPFRQQTAGKAFYEAPALDNSRPGIYYANLYRMSNMPIYQMEGLAYHEGIPGHHMQLALAQELDGLPLFRRLSNYTAYSEGWGLYSELLPKEIGMYQDPYSDFGRLAMELWRACRLVVDTGLHHKKWTREQAITYLVQNTPNAMNDAERAIDRYIVMPGQATSYKIGMIKILELRAKARNALGNKFDIRAFHETLLSHGPLPLDVLEEQIDLFIANMQKSH